MTACIELLQNKLDSWKDDCEVIDGMKYQWIKFGWIAVTRWLYGECSLFS